ncbi:MAG TPA: D-amino-acid transaminase [Caulobacterales bacterium]|nr:D-amino-acid transaminase [Caulobacterales bacterium]
MSRFAYVNGAYVPHARAAVHIEDRGYQFADAVYEVWAVRAGKLLDREAHFDRLERSLRELRIAPPAERRALDAIVREVARRNRVRNGLVYLQISRGAAPRDHAFPSRAAPALVVTAKSLDMKAIEARAEAGVRVISAPDIRWARCDIKSTGLLANVLAKQEARERGAFEAWFVDENGDVTEGASTTAWIVDAEGALITRELDNRILPGVTRAALLRAARDLQMKVIERRFSLAEAKAAPEAFISSASGAAVPVIAIDDAPIGSGKPGAVVARLRRAYMAQT